MTTVQEITSENGFNSIVDNLQSSTLAVIYFHAPWAAPCKQMSDVLEALASTYAAASPIAFLSINAEEVPEVAEAYDVTAVPLVILQKDKQKLQELSGSNAASVRSAVEKFYSNGTTDDKWSNLPPEQRVTRPPEGQEATPFQQSESNGLSSTTSNGNGTASNTTSEAPKEVDKEALFKRLEGLVKAASVMLFMKGTPSAPQCGFSRQLVALLRERSIRYGFFNILADDDVRQGLKEFSDWPTFPQLYVEGELIGGLDIVREEVENNPEFLAQYSANSGKVEA